MMSTAEPLIEIENLCVQFTQERQKAFALRGIDISFYKDEIHGWSASLAPARQ